MVYYGLISHGISVNPVYAMLRNAFKNMPEDAPFRGPKKLKAASSSTQIRGKAQLSNIMAKNTLPKKD